MRAGVARAAAVALALLASVSGSAQSPPASDPSARRAVLVTQYQSLGSAAELDQRLFEALRAQVVARSWQVVEATDAAKLKRAAAMCGEDSSCLATVGQRGGSLWVLAFGIGRIGPETAMSALLVDTARGTGSPVFLERFSVVPVDLSGVARRIVDAVFKDVRDPAIVALPSLSAGAVRGRRLRPWAITSTALAGVGAAVTGVLGVLAMQNYQGLPQVPIAERGAADARQRTLNFGADAALAFAVGAASTAVLLWLLDLREAAAP